MAGETLARIDTALAALALELARRHGLRASEMYPLAVHLRDAGGTIEAVRRDLTDVCELANRLRLSFADALHWFVEIAEETEEEEAGDDDGS